MSKRKEMEDSGDEQELVDVNFDYYNVDASNDYHAIHRLLIQLFGPDGERIQTGPLAELVARVAEESGVGSTIKTEEEEGSDPYAVLTAISCREHAGLEGVIAYVLSQTRADQGFHAALSSALGEHVGLVLSERLVNMPVQVMGPMYRLLADELDEAGCAFTHLLFVSRVFRLTAAEEAAMRDSKRHRPARADGVYGFHAEDDEIMQHASHVATYAFCDGESHVGVAVSGRAMLVPGSEFKVLVNKIEATYACE